MLTTYTLQKYNNDVMRAADYIFSGHADQDAVDVCIRIK